MLISKLSKLLKILFTPILIGLLVFPYFFTLFNSSSNVKAAFSTPSGVTVVKVAEGVSNYSLALMSDGSVWAWGANNYGQLGMGNTDNGDITVTPEKFTPRMIPSFGPGSGVTDIVAGRDHALALKGGVVYAWGANSYGRTGLGTDTGNTLVPTKVHDGNIPGGNTGIEQIAAEMGHSLALKDGVVYSWGSNANGQTGLGTTVDNTLVPTKVYDGDIPGGNAGIEQVAAGGNHSLALKDGVVYAWGANNNGQTGLDTNTGNTLVPTKVHDGEITAGNTGITQVVAGWTHSFVIKDSVVYAWGMNNYGVTGLGTAADNTLVPTKVHDGEIVGGNVGIEQVSAGYSHSLAIKDDGAMYAWGFNGNGRTGLDITAGNTLVPTKVRDDEITGGNLGITQVSAGWNHSLSIKDGVMYAWGANSNGQVGNGNNTSPRTPVQVLFPDVAIMAVEKAEGSRQPVDITTAREVVNGLLAGSKLRIELTARLDVLQAEIAPTLANVNKGYISVALITFDSGMRTALVARIDAITPVKDIFSTSSGVTVVKVVDGLGALGEHSLALMSDGSVWAWGSNDYGQLGMGSVAQGDFASNPERFTPRMIPALGPGSGVTDIGAGSGFSLALKDGVVYTWGMNTNGRLGDGTVTDRYTPVKVADGVIPGGNAGIEQVAVGGGFSIAIKDGTAYTWGSNSNGQLGDGTMTERHTPVKVDDGEIDGGNVGITQVSAGSVSLAIKNGVVYAWGLNNYGLTGLNTVTGNTLVPTKVHDGNFENGNLGGITYVSAGSNHCLAVKDGVVYSWGTNSGGRTGLGTDVGNTLVPTKVYDNAVFTNSDITQVATGWNHTLVLKDGVVYAWGTNTNGRLGDGTSTTRTAPVKVSDGKFDGGNVGVNQVSASQNHSLALKDGVAYGWGYNGRGQLGDGTNVDRRTPMKVLFPDVAIIAVEKVEESKLPGDIAVAHEVVNRLLAGSKLRIELGARLDVLQVEVEPTAANISNAHTSVALVTFDSDMYTALIDRVNAVVINAVEEAEESEEPADITAARTLVNALPTSSKLHIELRARLDVLQAEITRTLADINNAYISIALITFDSGLYANLMDRIDAIVASLSVYEQASAAVYKAQATKKFADFNKAQNLVNALIVDTHCTQAEKDSLIAWLDAIASYFDVESAVKKAETTKTFENFTTAQNLVNGIGVNFTQAEKDAFQKRLDAIVESYVKTAEKNRDAASKSTAQDFVTGLPNGSVKTAFQVRLDAIEVDTPSGSGDESVQPPVVGKNGAMFMINVNGTVSSWGSNQFGQLGRAGTSNQSKAGTIIFPALGTDIIREVVVGYNGGQVMYAITEQGYVYAWGTGTTDGMLGTGDGAGTITPTKVIKADNNELQNVDKLIVGFENGRTMYAVTKSGEIWAWGFENGNGMLGTGDNSPQPKAKKVINQTTIGLTDNNIVAVAQGYTADGVQTMFAVTKNNEKLYSWGDNSQGQLAVGDTMNNVWRNRKAIALGVTTDGGTWTGDNEEWMMDVTVPIGLVFSADTNGNLTVPTKFEIINNTSQPIKVLNSDYTAGTWSLISSNPSLTLNTKEFMVGTNYNGQADLLSAVKLGLPNQTIWGDTWSSQGAASANIVMNNTSSPKVAQQTKGETLSAGSINLVFSWY